MPILVFIFWRLPQAFLRFFMSLRQCDVVHMRRDATLDRYVHLFLEHNVDRIGGGSGSAFQHALLDLDTYRVRCGPKQSGAKLELDSPFVERSLARASQRLGQTLALGPGVSHKGITVKQTDVELFGAIQPGDGRQLHVQSRFEPSSGESSAKTRVKVSYFVGGVLCWSMQGVDAWLGPEKCFLVAGDRLCILYDDAVDTRLLVLNAQTGAVLADRYLLPLF